MKLTSNSGRRVLLAGLAVASATLLVAWCRFQWPSAPPSGLQSELSYVPCNLSLAEEFYRARPRDGSVKAELFRHRAGQLLSDVTAALHTLKVPSWLGSGTMLGWLRQCDLVPAMSDVDLEVASEALWAGGISVDQLVAAVERAGPRLKNKFGLPLDSMELTFSDKHGTLLDLFWSYPSRHGRWIGGVDTDNLTKLRWYYPSITLCWSVLRQVRVGVPCHPEAYLRTFYGPHWHASPSRPWDYLAGHTGVQLAGQWLRRLAGQMTKIVSPVPPVPDP